MAQNYSNVVAADYQGNYQKLYEEYRDKYRELAAQGGGSADLTTVQVTVISPVAGRLWMPIIDDSEYPGMWNWGSLNANGSATFNVVLFKEYAFGGIELDDTVNTYTFTVEGEGDCEPTGNHVDFTVHGDCTVTITAPVVEQ